MLQVSDLTVSYGEKDILKEINFEISSGLNVILGQNGSGKTTLFRTLSGTLKPKYGQVFLGEENLLALSAKNRASRIAQVLGSHQTLSGITGQDLAEMSFYHANGMFFAVNQAQKDRIITVAEEMGAKSLLSRFLDTMSAGERQMIELVSAICQDTPVLLLDEPTSALDFNRTHEFLIRAKSLGRQKILFASLHDPALALEYADRILLLKDGNIVGDFLPSRNSAEKTEKLLQQLYPDIRVVSVENKLSVLYRSSDDPKGNV